MTKLQPHLTLEPKKEYLDICLQRYGITRYTYSLPERGIENTTVFVKALDNREYVLRIYKQQAYTLEDIYLEIQFTNYLHDQGLPVPRAIFNNDDAQLTQQDIAGKVWYMILMPRLPGRHVPLYTKDVVSELGMYLGKLHNASLMFKGYDYSSPLTPVRETLLDVTKIENVSQEYVVLLNRAKQFTIHELNAPHAIIHCDFVRGNTLFDDDKLTAILDFEAVKHGYLIEDIATLLWGIIFNIVKKGSSEDLISAFFAAYTSQRMLSKEEYEHLPQFLLFRTYVLSAVDYLTMKDENDLKDDLMMETEAINRYTQWLQSK